MRMLLIALVRCACATEPAESQGCHVGDRTCIESSGYGAPSTHEERPPLRCSCHMLPWGQVRQQAHSAGLRPTCCDARLVLLHVACSQGGGWPTVSFRRVACGT